ncbi:hypothetical protein CN481_05040 [Bacillus sp. AFS006103]|nr:hypothetical protein CN481_05040 [Bacillus sp. AFS006103]
MSAYFSVILPVYNVEKYLERCVKSVLNQSFKDIEIILVDDGSTDGSGNLCDKLASKHSQVQAVHKENGGLASARNFGINYAAGKYVCFIDSDDWVELDMFETLRREINDKDFDIIKFGFQKRSNSEIISKKVPFIEEGIYSRNQIINELLPEAIGRKRLFDYSVDFILSAWASLYRLEFIKKNNIFFVSEREILNEDFLFNINALVNAETLIVLHKVLYNYDERPGSLTQRYRKEMFSRKKNLYNKYEEILNRIPQVNQYQMRLYHFYIDAIYDCITNECNKYSINNSHKESIRKIKSYLSDIELREALKNCSLSNTSTKGKIIFILMKYRMSITMFYLYRLMKKI